MVEVSDFGLGPGLLIAGERTFEFAWSQELAVLNHEAARLEQQLQGVAYENIVGPNGEDARLVRFPYRLREVSLS